MEANISLIKKIGNFFSNILLGETKEIIVRMDERLLHISKRIDAMEPDLQNLRERFVVVEDRVKNAWKDDVAPAHSPRKLNERGNSILQSSGVKDIVDQRKSELLSIIKSKNILNPYDAEQFVLQIVADLKKDSMLLDQLKTGAFSVGADIDTVLLVGGIYLRDQIFPELGFSVDQIDLHKK